MAASTSPRGGRIEHAKQFAVTEEVKGGAPVPTLKAMVLAGA